MVYGNKNCFVYITLARYGIWIYKSETEITLPQFYLWNGNNGNGKLYKFKEVFIES